MKSSSGVHHQIDLDELLLKKEICETTCEVSKRYLGDRNSGQFEYVSLQKPVNKPLRNGLIESEVEPLNQTDYDMTFKCGSPATDYWYSE